MDTILSVDPELASELLKVFLEKIKNLKGDLERIRKENHELQQEVTQLRKRPLSTNTSLADSADRGTDQGVASACAAGMCPEAARANRAERELRELQERLRSLESTRKDDATLIREMREELRIRTRKHDEDLDKLNEALRALDHANRQLMEYGSQTESFSDEKPAQSNHHSTNTVPEMTPRPIRDGFSEPHLPNKYQGKNTVLLLRRDLQHLSSYELLFCPEFMLYTKNNVTASMLVPEALCLPNQIRGTWDANRSLSNMLNRTHTFFYEIKNEVRYAGSFECFSQGPLPGEGFGTLSKGKRVQLAQETMKLQPKTTKLDLDYVLNKYHSGKAVLMVLGFRFVGFDRRINDAILSMRDSESPRWRPLPGSGTPHPNSSPNRKRGRSSEPASPGGEREFKRPRSWGADFIDNQADWA